MGYTHYWYRPATIEESKYKAIVKDFRKVLKPMRFDDELGIRIDLGDGMGDNKPKINNREVVFNGRRSKGEDYETFFFPPTDEGYVDERYGKVFNFCKTAERPYDIAVQVFLVIAKHHLGSDIIVKSDGDFTAWERAVEIVEKYLGYGDDFYLGDEPHVEDVE